MNARLWPFDWTRRTAYRVGRLSVLAMLAVAAVALGQQPEEAVPKRPTVLQLIARLEAPTFKERQAAAAALVREGLGARSAVMQALGAGKASPETFARLRLVADQLHGFATYWPYDAPKETDRLPGPADLLCIIDNDEDYRRYRRAIPSLPAGFESQFHRWQLLLAIVWDTQPRVILRPTEDGDTLVLQVAEGRIQTHSDMFRPPKYLLARVAAWPGPVRVMFNGQPRFTRWKGKAFEEQAARQWAEIERLHKGGEPTAEQRTEANRPSWGGTPSVIINEFLKEWPHGQIALLHLKREELRAILEIEFRRLADMRATPIIGKVFEMAEGFVEFDPAFEGAWHALAAIGSPEVAAGCEKAARSKNRFAQRLASLVARDLGFEVQRRVFHAGLSSSDTPTIRGAMNGLDTIGWCKDEVPALIALISRGMGEGDYTESAAIYLGNLGRDAAAALPALEKLRTHPFDNVRKAATQAIEKIGGAR